MHQACSAPGGMQIAQSVLSLSRPEMNLTKVSEDCSKLWGKMLTGLSGHHIMRADLEVTCGVMGASSVPVMLMSEMFP